MAGAGAVIALDTNLLVYAHRSAMAEHNTARRAIEAACNHVRGCGVAIASVAEFYAVVTHPRASGRPSTPAEATSFLRELQEAGGLRVWSPSPGFGDRLLQVATDLDVRGARVFDLQIGLVALENGATEIWSHDRKFVRIAGLKVHDPCKA